MESSYINKQNKEQPCYKFGVEGTLQLGARYSAETRYKLIQHIKKLEEEKNNPYKVPQNYKEALLLAVEQQEKIEAQQEKLIEQEPKVIFADAIVGSKTSITVGELAKLMKQNGVNIGRTRLFKALRQMGYLIKRKGVEFNLPTQKGMNAGLFEIKEVLARTRLGDTIINRVTLVTPKGQLFFINKALKKQNS